MTYTTIDEREIVDVLEALSKGNYDAPTPGTGPVAEAISRLKTKLQSRAAHDLKQTVALSQGASEAMAAVSFVTGDVREAAANANNIAAAVEELDAAISQIAEASNRVADDAADARSAANSGLQSIDEATAAMGDISRAVGETAEAVRGLSQASDQIGRILKAITVIAKQTNLLALNATIEAARAGEVGKAFAVVAGEVKALANETAAAADQIRSQITDIQSEVQTISTKMDQTTQVVSKGNESIRNVDAQVRSVVAKIDEVSQQVSANAAAVTEQTAATQEVARSVTIISEKSLRSESHAENAVKAVAGTETVLQQQFEYLSRLTIPNAMIELAKSDHVLWKKKLAEMLVGYSELNEEELVDHHSCRLGRWCNSDEAAKYAGHPAFRQLEAPHAQVHAIAKEVVRLFKGGDRDAAEAMFQKLTVASNAVVQCLEDLSR